MKEDRKVSDLEREGEKDDPVAFGIRVSDSKLRLVLFGFDSFRFVTSREPVTGSQNGRKEGDALQGLRCFDSKASFGLVL